MPEGNKIWVLGDGVGPNRPATNFPGISLDSNRFDCLVEKSGLDIEPRPESPVGHRGFFVRSKTGVWPAESVKDI
jgi:hypothetical protein